ncbi:hypothetical protein ACFWD7_54450 [Streptomyces mirabilis]|uniref:hypothetical protein n=1 Tax=Streptomyces mirabilis TaxID=68239 RepID=UPI00368F6F8E
MYENLKVPGSVLRRGLRRNGERTERRSGPHPRRAGSDRYGTSWPAPYAAVTGLETVAVARGADKAAPAKQLGAHHCIHSTADTPLGDAPQSLGGDKAVSGRRRPLRRHHPRPWTGCGRPGGTMPDTQDTTAFSALRGIRPTTEIVPLDRTEEAYRQTLSGAARFRLVLTTR